MTFLLDTHLLIWAVAMSPRLSSEANRLIRDLQNTIYFSSASIWEVAIKSGKKIPDFTVDPDLLRTSLLSRGYRELPISGVHAAAVLHLPAIHNDPFDRILLAQAIVEGFTLLTTDARLSGYPGPVRKL